MNTSAGVSHVAKSASDLRFPSSTLTEAMAGCTSCPAAGSFVKAEGFLVIDNLAWKVFQSGNSRFCIHSSLYWAHALHMKYSDGCKLTSGATRPHLAHLSWAIMILSQCCHDYSVNRAR